MYIHGFIIYKFFLHQNLMNVILVKLVKNTGKSFFFFIKRNTIKIFVCFLINLYLNIFPFAFFLTLGSVCVVSFCLILLYYFV